MKLNKYLKAKSDLKKVYNAAVKKLNKQFADENNPFKIGSITIIKDHQYIIKFDKISYYHTYLEEESVVCCVYHGIKLNTNLKPYKREKRECIFQTNIKKYYDTEEKKWKIYSYNQAMADNL